jgi:hypothetical protein
MAPFHVAVDHIDPDTLALTSTYLGTVDQDHVDQVRAIAALPGTERWVKEDEDRQPGSLFVLRDDGDLDVYVPVDAALFEIRTPDGADIDKDAPTGDDQPKTAMPMGTTVSGPAYIDGAVRFGDQVIGGAMDHPESGPRVTWHSTESPSGSKYFYSVAAYLMRVASEPQVIYDPTSDLLGQFGPLTQSGRALRNDGTRRTNREGLVNIQVEVLARASSPWTTGFAPAKKPNYRKLLAAARAHGVPDVWPAGKPPKSPGGSYPRPRSTWQSKPGHYDHGQVPGNDHTDFGACDTAIVPGNADSDPSTPTPTPTPAQPVAPDAFPGASKFGPGANNAYVTQLGRMLVKRGGKRFYKKGPGSKWGTADKNATAAFQRAQGWTGQDADGIPGAKTWSLLVTGKGKDIPAAAVAVKYEPFPGSAFFHGGRHSQLITEMGHRLVAEGCGHYAHGPGPDWTNADKKSYAAWQRKLGYSGDDANGIPGQASWDALKVPQG